MECVELYIWLDELGFKTRRNDVVTMESLLGMQCLVHSTYMEQWVKCAAANLLSNMVTQWLL